MENNELELKKKAALKGDNEACLFVALWYANNAHRDDYEAHKWFGLGAKRGHVLCQFYYGNDFDVGEGCEVDPFQALHWYKMAADQGHEYAKMMVEWTTTKIHTGFYERRTKNVKMKEQILKLNDAINYAVSLLLHLRHPNLYGIHGPSFEYIEEFVQKTLIDYDNIYSICWSNSEYNVVIHEMGLNIDFIKMLAKPYTQLNEFLIERWENGFPSEFCGLSAYYISREKIEKMMDVSKR